MTAKEERRAARRAAESLTNRIVFELEQLQRKGMPPDMRAGVRAALHVVKRIGKEAS